MARYEHLPIFRHAYDLTLELDRRVHRFSRYHKYSIGSDLRDTSRELLRLIIWANNTAERRTVLEDIRRQAEYLKVMLRLAYETGAFPGGNKAYLFLAERAVEIAKQNEGWIKSGLSTAGGNRNKSEQGDR